MSVTLWSKTRKSEGEIIQREEPKNQPGSVGTCAFKDVLGRSESGPESASKSLNLCKGQLYGYLFKKYFPYLFKVYFTH